MSGNLLGIVQGTALVSTPILAFPDCSQVFIYASNQGIGAVLSQYDDCKNMWWLTLVRHRVRRRESAV